MGPETLKNLAMKAVLDLDLEDYAQLLPVTSRVGLYASGKDLPEHISDRGRRYLKEMREMYMKYGGKKMIFDEKQTTWTFLGDD